MMASNCVEGVALGKAVFARLEKRGNKWKTRNIPKHIRDLFWHPYYFTETQGEQQLYIIQPPNVFHDKVHFARWPLSDTG